jgi:inner membrane protein
MDFLTHALLPYLLGSFLHIEKKRLSALVLGGMAPDLDVLVSWIGSLYPTSLLLVHRGITHSLFFGFFFALLVLYLARQPRVKGLFSRAIPYDPDLSPGSVVFLYAGVLLHLLLDWTTTRGVPLFYPWQALRYSADIFFQIEPAALISSLVIVAALMRDRSLVRIDKNLFVLFALFLLVVGGIRMDGKDSALAAFPGADAAAYPESGLFSWAVLQEDGDRYLVYEYDYLHGFASGGSAFPRLTVASREEEAEKAIAIADELSTVKLFRWRAYAVAINATSFENGTWSIEYYDPVVRVETHDSGFFRPPSKSYQAVRVTVEDEVARVAE